MEMLAELLKSGCKLYAGFEEGRYLIRIQHQNKKELSVLVESESFLHAIHKAVDHMKQWNATQLQHKNVQSS